MTGSGMMECKDALKEAGGDLEKAVDVLRIKGANTAEKKKDRNAAQSEIFSYVHSGRIGVLLEIACESDFVKNSEQFQEMGKNIAMHIAAAHPLYLDQESVPSEDLEREQNIHKATAGQTKKPQKIIDKIVEGKMRKFYEEKCLLDQKYVRDDKLSIKEYVTSVVATLKENIVIKFFTRHQAGE